MINPFDLTGKVALVTGANTGIGQGIAVALAKAGADIAAVDVAPLDETQDLVEAAGRRFLGLKADLTSIAPVPGLIEEAVGRYGQLDILVNNAGLIRRADAVDFTEADWDLVMNINIKTLFFFCQAFGRYAINAGRKGKIINIASMLSFQGGIRVPSYTASKSGVAGITRLLACEWAGKGINVNAIAPGYVATNNTAALRADENRSAEILGRIPAGRWSVPSDMGGPAVFLASEAADYIHGTILPVDGGWLAR
ncbi:2-dehydro-3-deoxy-D-gluconate 5-dehydrogenase KduD [Azospirillum rugosum]|uniref:2-deoxy-D-gluconate 3-dehydrogenase n=1 Tax=Azospirillum rugosum TaxID=416170 RepID=A0ABS4SDN2_9PROT|nr:2-dehydro-3-deoxy-D-gluconate 5-dehydrogenase KduD [Azospirillum rugosum]MBP2290687.1 2-deoxy-D-gluconate 3-dehydrogenase [Azospirillum rugosum]MDQ0525575.1 2-deoxy-D-gluconate 3-dehydrogenase [Azospirillum rugosum]